MSATKGILQRNILLYLMHCRVCLLASSTLQSLKTSAGQKTPKISQIKILLMLFFFSRNRPSKKLKVQCYIWKMVHLEAAFSKEIKELSKN